MLFLCTSLCLLEVMLHIYFEVYSFDQGGEWTACSETLHGTMVFSLMQALPCIVLLNRMCFCLLQVSVCMYVLFMCVVADTFQTRHVCPSWVILGSVPPTGDQIVKTMKVFGHYNCLAFRITGGNCGWFYSQTCIVT